MTSWMLLIYPLLASICSTQVIYLGANEPRRETECSQAECEVNCFATQCGNEFIKATKKPGRRGSWVEEMKITMNCQEKYTCGGEIIIDGEKKYVPSTAEIRCDENPKKSCYGGQYVLTELNKGSLIGDATQTDILFKNMGKAEISIPRKADSPPEQFFMNRVWTENIHRFSLTVEVERSVMGSYFDLTGVRSLEIVESKKSMGVTVRKRSKTLTRNIYINCEAEYSCIGSIFVFKKCGGRAKIICGPGACAEMSILVLDEDCGSTIYGTETNPLVTIIAKENDELEPSLTSIYAVCPSEHRGCCVKQDKSDTAFTHATILIGTFPETRIWLERMTAVLIQLQDEYNGAITRKELVTKRPNQWIREGNHVNYLAGVMFEAAIGSFLSAPATLTGATGKKIVGGTITAGLGIGLGSIAWPLIIPGLVVAGVGGVIYLKKQKLKKKYKIPGHMKAFVPAGHEEINNIYNEYEDEINSLDYAVLDPAAHFDDLINGKILHGATEMDDMSMNYDNMNMNMDAYNSQVYEHHLHPANISHDNMLLAVLLGGILIVLCGILILKFVCVGCLGFILKRKYNYKSYDRKYEEIEV